MVCFCDAVIQSPRKGRRLQDASLDASYLIPGIASMHVSAHFEAGGLQMFKPLLEVKVDGG